MAERTACEQHWYKCASRPPVQLHLFHFWILIQCSVFYDCRVEFDCNKREGGSESQGERKRESGKGRGRMKEKGWTSHFHKHISLLYLIRANTGTWKCRFPERNICAPQRYEARHDMAGYKLVCSFMRYNRIPDYVLLTWKFSAFFFNGKFIVRPYLYGW